MGIVRKMKQNHRKAIKQNGSHPTNPPPLTPVLAISSSITSPRWELTPDLAISLSTPPSMAVSAPHRKYRMCRKIDFYFVLLFKICMDV